MKAKNVIFALLVNTLLVPGVSAQTMPLVYAVENTGTDVPAPAFPSISNLPNINALPDPFLWADGSIRISKYTEWRRRRAEISAQVQHYLLGNKPAPPDSLQARLSQDTLIVSVTVGGKSLTLHATIAFNFGEIAARGAPRGEGGFCPFNPSTTIRFALPQRSFVSLAIYNTLGQKVVHLVNGEVDAGYHEIKCDASALASGVYFYRLQAGGYVETRKLCFAK
jgi:hypothetical protein